MMKDDERKLARIALKLATFDDVAGVGGAIVGRYW